MSGLITALRTIIKLDILLGAYYGFVTSLVFDRHSFCRKDAVFPSSVFKFESVVFDFSSSSVSVCVYVSECVC